MPSPPCGTIAMPRKLKCIRRNVCKGDAGNIRVVSARVGPDVAFEAGCVNEWVKGTVRVGGGRATLRDEQMNAGIVAKSVNPVALPGPMDPLLTQLVPPINEYFNTAPLGSPLKVRLPSVT